MCTLEGKAGAGPKNEDIVVCQVVPFHSYNYHIFTFNLMFSVSAIHSAGLKQGFTTNHIPEDIWDGPIILTH